MAIIKIKNPKISQVAFNNYHLLKINASHNAKTVIDPNFVFDAIINITFNRKKTIIDTKRYILLVIFYCLLSKATLYAQNFPKFTFTKSAINANLPTEALNYVYKDSKGLLWISSLNGLCRYDGNSIKIFSKDEQKRNAIASNSAYSITEDIDGNIWIAHNKVVSRYNRYKNDFTSYKHSINNNNDTNELINGLLTCSNKNEIVLGDNKGYNNFYYDPKIDCFRNIKTDTTNDGFNNKANPNSLIGKLITAQNSKDLYLASVHGLFSYNTITGIKKRVSNSSLYTPMDIYKDSNGKLWLCEWDGGLSIIDPVTKEQKNIIANKTFGSIADFKDVNGKLWLIASEFRTSSIAIIDPETKQYTFQVIKTENGKNPNVIAGKIQQIGPGKIYFTTNNGLYQMEEDRQSITNVYTYTLGKPIDVFYDNLVRAGIQLQNNNYIFSKLGKNGLLIYDSNLVLKNTIKNYSYNGKLYELDVRAFCKLADNKYYLSGPTGIAIFDNGKIKPIIYSALNNTLPNAFREMLPIDENNYWIRLVAGGIVKFNAKTNTISEPITFAKDSVPLTNVITILYDKAGKLWVITETHVLSYNNGSNQFEVEPINVLQKKLRFMRSACFDANQNLWITGEGGLLHYNTTTKSETLYDYKNGLKEEEVFKVLLFDNSSLIITHKTGLVHFNFITKTFTNISNNAGLPYGINEYDAALFLDKNNNLLLGNTGAFTKINLSNFLKEKSENTKIEITQIEGSSYDEEIKIENGRKKVNLYFKNFPVNILFSVINYANSNEISYYYRYKGKDTSWLPSKFGVVPVNTISPGTYTIEVTGALDGKFVGITDSITFTIVPRWFETILFKIIATILSLIALFALYKWRMNTAKKSTLQQNEIQKLAEQEYKNQLELLKVSSYFSTSISSINNSKDVLWDVCNNLISQLGFEDSVIYIWNKDKTKLIQKAGCGFNRNEKQIESQPFETALGQGVVGHVALTKEPLIIPDTRLEKRYRFEEKERLSEISVPILYKDELLGVIDSEHSTLNFFTQTHLQLLTTIAGYIAAKLTDIKNNEALLFANNQLNEVQLDALRSQMNPHFIFNCLNSIKLYTAQNQNAAAADYLTKFSKLMRKSLENSRSHQISLADELETLELYIQLEGMRFKEKLKYSIYLSSEIDSTFVEIPPMLLQPHVENAIWHGLMHKDEGGNLNITVSKQPDNDVLIITIEDDGIGREKAAILKSKSTIEHKSFGTKLTDERLSLINKIYNINAQIIVTDIINNGEIAGTRVTLNIPFE